MLALQYWRICYFRITTHQLFNDQTSHRLLYTLNTCFALKPLITRFTLSTLVSHVLYQKHERLDGFTLQGGDDFVQAPHLMAYQLLYKRPNSCFTKGPSLAAQSNVSSFALHTRGAMTTSGPAHDGVVRVGCRV